MQPIAMDAISGFESLRPLKTAKCDEEIMKHEKEEPLSPMARVFHEPGSNVYIVTIIGWRTKIHPDLLKANLANNLAKHPRFSSLQVASKGQGENIVWVPTNVDMDEHLIVPNIDPDMDSPDKWVEDYISDLSTTGIDKSKPMWDIHHLNVKTSDAEAVTVLRVHHSLGDGTSLMSLFLASTRKASDPKALPDIAVTKKSTSTRSGGLYQLLLMMWSTITGVFLFLMTALFLNDTKTPLKGPPGVEFGRRRFVYRMVSLDDIKLVKNSLNTTVNDVVVGVVQAGLSRYLNRRYGEAETNNREIDEKKNYLPKKTLFRAIFFFNLRPPAGINHLADLMKKGTKNWWGNKIGYVLLPIKIAFQDSPLDYVREAKVSMDRKKASFEPTFSYVAANLALRWFGSKAAGILCYKVFSHATMWFSNVPGPREEVACCGHPIAYVVPSLYGQPNALMIHAVSYMDKMTFILSADEATIPDPHRLCDDLEESLKLITNAVLSRHA